MYLLNRVRKIIVMRRKFLKIIFLSLYVCSLISCNSSVSDRIDKELPVNNTDTLVKQIPFRIQHSPDVKELKDAKVRTLGLPSLENGFPKFQLRIWEDFENLTGRVIIIKNDYDNWSAELYTYKFLSNSAFRPDSLSGQKLHLEEPRSGWNNFLNRLLDLKILSLPDFQSISNYDFGTDAGGVSIEIAKDKYYRFYEYPDPYFQQNKIPQAKKIVQILELIKKEFDLKNNN